MSSLRTVIRDVVLFHKHCNHANDATHVLLENVKGFRYGYGRQVSVPVADGRWYCHCISGIHVCVPEVPVASRGGLDSRLTLESEGIADRDRVAVHLEKYGPQIGLGIPPSVPLVMTLHPVQLQFDI